MSTIDSIRQITIASSILAVTFVITKYYFDISARYSSIMNEVIVRSDCSTTNDFITKKKCDCFIITNISN